jgi:hypothetical protein
LANYISITQQCAAKYESSPVMITARILDKKFDAMYRNVEKLGRLKISRNGGWCELDGYLEQWGGIILETRVKDNPGFPADEELPVFDILSIENSPYKTKMEDLAIFGVNSGVIYTITNLQETDSDYVIENIKKAKTRYISSQFTSPDEIQKYANILSSMGAKKILIHPIGKPALTAISNFISKQSDLSQHEIIVKSIFN